MVIKKQRLFRFTRKSGANLDIKSEKTRISRDFPSLRTDFPDHRADCPGHCTAYLCLRTAYPGHCSAYPGLFRSPATFCSAVPVSWPSCPLSGLLYSCPGLLPNLPVRWPASRVPAHGGAKSCSTQRAEYQLSIIFPCPFGRTRELYN